MFSSSRPAPARLALKPVAAAGIAAIACALSATGASAADADPALAATVQKLLERVQQLEQRNQALERRVQDLTPKSPAAAAAPVAAQAPGSWGAAPDARLQQVERQQQALQQQVSALAAPAEPADEGGDEGVSVEAGIVAVAQGVNGGGSADGRSQSRANYRGDVVVTLPAGSLGDARGTVVGHLRFGQGTGLGLRPTYTGTVNSTTFEPAAGSDEAYAIVAQAYYQFDWPLDAGRFNDLPGNRVEMTIGKIDLFGFFDQNAVAGDEGAQFLNNVFVHNPMLDSGGDIAADAYGFAPGARVGYFSVGETLAWGASLGVFASGPGATFDASLGRPLVIAQFEVSPMQINGEPRGSYRVYAWTNGHTTDLDGVEQRHTGFGLSADQRIGREWNLFGRYGQRTTGEGTFDRGLTLGFEHGGRAWGRGHDAVGLAAGWLKTDPAWRDATADGTLAGYAASGNEQIAELYYRMKLNANLELTPDFQLVKRAGGDGLAPTAKVFGLRASLGF